MISNTLLTWLRANPDVTDDAAAVKAVQAANQVPSVLSAEALLGVISEATLQKLIDNGTLAPISQLIAAGDKHGTSVWALALLKVGALTQDEFNAIGAHLAPVPAPELANLTTDDVAAARKLITRQDADSLLRRQAAQGYNAVVTLLDGVGPDAALPAFADLAKVFTAAGA